MAREWTPERRQQQRELIHRVKPWKKSTGPKTKAGKRRSSTNAKKPASIELWAALWDARQKFMGSE